MKISNKSIFERIHADENGTPINKDTIQYRLYKINKNGQDIFVLYDDNMDVISPAYRYINIAMASQSYNSREKAMYAVRLLYCFLQLTKTKITKLKQDDIEKLKYFLLGYSPEKGSYSMQLQTVRSNATVNGYLNVYRSYLKYINIECDYLFETKKAIIKGINRMTEKAELVTSYSSNIKTGTPVQRVPRYISVDNFPKIIKIIRKDENKMAECIVRIMYQFGLRLGEVLGLTFEDVVEENIDGNLYPVLYIRNRSTDKHFQKAKTCMNITDKAQFRSKDYKTENYGYQKVIVTYDIYELINTYIEDAHSAARSKNMTRYKSGVSADKAVKDKYETDNYYVFINSIGTALSEQIWNKYIKSVFKRAEIPIDSNSKKTNLNHKFRHGFAMFHVQYRKTPLLELQKLMRHASISSTMVYYNPTEADEAAIKNDFVNELYDLIPDLRSGNI
ncbi:site-specific integrase [Bacillaceae bacterium CLA-AA-H227]|uniref:Site-specific integrase n=1 Tax=Robertmurraya yapensis (ex Hitch et al 2024) TaxID=3133160 RepID=A0ACC6SGC2_9BACI